MSGENICRLCAGSGEGIYLYPIPFSMECREVNEDCRACRGSGFEPVPTFRTKQEAIERVALAMVALDLAIKAIERKSA